jgi:hypothetical protein
VLIAIRSLPEFSNPEPGRRILHRIFHRIFHRILLDDRYCPLLLIAPLTDEASY